jgi:hypothetical protein
MWADAVSDLYKFAYKHSDDISIRNGQLAISSGTIRDQFNAELDHAEQLRKNFIDADEKYNTARSASLKQQGVTPSDLGFSQ